MIDFYDYPKYYHIAFSYRDIPKEVDVFEECIRRFAKTPVKQMLELCCGPAPHMVEYAKNRTEELGSRLCGNDKLKWRE